MRTASNQFEIVDATSWETLEERVRQTTLLKDSGVMPYADASISLEEIAYSDVRPTALYVLRKNLATQAAIGASLLGHSLHPLELDGGLVLQKEGEAPVGFVPPIVEETDEEGLYILDGAHRTTQGRWAGRTTFMAIHVKGIREGCPGYALPNEWDDIKLFEEVPEDKALRKRYRENSGVLYKDFGPLNGSAPRVKRARS